MFIFALHFHIITLLQHTAVMLLGIFMRLATSELKMICLVILIKSEIGLFSLWKEMFKPRCWDLIVEDCVWSVYMML